MRDFSIFYLNLYPAKGLNIERLTNEAFMKINRAIRAIQALYNARNKTLTSYELNKVLNTNWSPRAISEARQLEGVIIDGDNPYTLVACPSNFIPPIPTFNPKREVYEYKKMVVEQLRFI